MPVEIAETQDIAACQSVRRAVFIEEQNVSPADEVDGRDPEALHLIATDAGRAVGAARILVTGEVAKIGRVCVLRSQRGTGLGARIIESCMKVAADQPGVRIAKLGAQVDAIGFYEKLGFVAFGPRYMDAGIEHQDMSKRL